jgi:hypothetical protein
MKLSTRDKNLLLRQLALFLTLVTFLELSGFGGTVLERAGLGRLAGTFNIQNAHAAGNTVIFVSSTASTTWTVPNDWNSASNTIEVIGGGGGGNTGGSSGAGGGAGGGYSKISSLSFVQGASTAIGVGSGGGAGVTGGDTFLSTSTSNNTCATSAACAKGGPGATSATGATAAATSSAVGTTKYKGGNGGTGNTAADSGGGGGGAAGPSGNGQVAGVGSASTTQAGGGGGGGSDSGAVGQAASSTIGGAGGNNNGGSGGGKGGTATVSSTVGTIGGGGGGGGGGTGVHAGSKGGDGQTLWTRTADSSTAGPGGGGGGAGGVQSANESTETGGNGGSYGAGGGGSELTAGSGAQGIIVITYTPTTASVPAAPGTPAYANITTSTLTVNWASSTNTIYYKLERATTSNVFAQITTTTALTFNDSGLTTNTTYYYRARGNNGNGDGSYSASSSVTTLSTNPSVTSFTNNTEALTDGGRSGDSIVLTGTNFGTVSAGSRANCAGGAGTGCVEFTVGGTDTVDDQSVTAWSSNSITFNVSTTLATLGGTSSLNVFAAGTGSNTSTFYVYPHLTGMAVCTNCNANAGREYNASDTDGLIQLNGDHFGQATGTVWFGDGFNNVTSTLHNKAEGACTSSGWIGSATSSNSACVEVAPAIADNVSTGTITLSRNGDVKTDIISFRALPRITAVNPNSASMGNIVQILGNHFCESGTCPVSPNRASSTDNVKFGAATSTDYGPVVIDATSTATCVGTGCFGLTFALTVGSGGTNRALGVFVSAAANSGNTEATVSSIAYNGVNLVQKIHAVPSSERWIDLWTLPDGTQPATGTNNVVVTLTGALVGANDRLTAGAISLMGVDQTSQLTSTSTNSGSGTALSVTLGSSGANDLAAASACNGTSLSTTHTGTQFYASGDDSLTACNTNAGITASGGTTSLTWTGGNDTWTFIAASFKAVAGGSSDFQNLTGGAGACNGSGAAWSSTEICVKVPAATPTGSASTTITSNASYLSNVWPFTVNSSAPNNPGALNQFIQGVATALSVGSSTTSTTMLFEANISSTIAINMALQVEAISTANTFACSGTGACAAASQGPTFNSTTSVTNASDTVSGLASAGDTGTSYHWQARAWNTSTTEASAWISFGGNGEGATDFDVDTNAPTITGVATSSVSASAATVTWNTSAESADSRVQYATSAPPGAWGSTTVLPNNSCGDAAVVSSGTVYLFESNLGTYYAVPNANGSISNWSSTAAFTNKSISFYAGGANNGYIYAMGGQDGTNSTSAVSYAKPNADGSIGNWSSTKPMPDRLNSFSSAVYGGYIYTTGGEKLPISTGFYATTSVYYAKPNADGSIGNWSSTTPLPANYAQHAAAAYGDYLYVTGGYNGTGNRNDVIYAPINATGSIGNWTSTTNLPDYYYYHTAFATNGYLYVQGGGTDTPNIPTSTTYYAPINATGSIGSWTMGTLLPSGLKCHSAVLNNGYFYTMGGIDTNSGGASTADVFYTTINYFNPSCSVNNDCTAVTDAVPPGTTSHSVGLSSLVSSTTYYFRARSKDDVQNEMISATSIFTTTASSNALPVTGQVTSIVFDSVALNGAAYNSILWKGTSGTGKVRFQFATSNSTSGPWTFIGGPTCTTGDYYSPGAPDTPAEITCAPQNHNNQRYYRYLIQICSDVSCSSAGTTSPVVSSAVVSWSP